MKTRSFVTIILTTAAAAGFTIAGCSGSNNPSNPTSTNNTTGNSTSNNSTGGNSTTQTTTTNNTGSSTGSTGTGGSSSSSGSTTASDAGSSDGGNPTCVSTLQDNVTPCTATDVQQCDKGCGPDLPNGSPLGKNLGTKTCTCTAGVYQCANCAYIAPLPLCYQESATPPTCEAGVADKLPCGTACTTGTGNDVCSTTSDAGKTEGCVCITASTGNVWTCATSPW